MPEITAKTVNEAWRGAIKLIIKEGRVFIDDKQRECHELANLIVTVENPSSAADGVRAMRSSRAWRYPSEEELANIMLNKESASMYDYIYGQRIFDFAGTLNQVDDYIIPLLQQRPNTRRAIISLVSPVQDLQLDAQNVVGVMLVHFRIIDKRLVATMVIRTSGFFTGWPANIFQLAQLQEHIAHALNIPVGSLCTISLSAHIHTDTLDQIKSVLG